ncbi:heat shock protein DnaJ domain protein [halophilic archaeon DL31]|jgi:curved DNA-binding protein CbpA|nr:heat shock protein DnaJ domain protein [halophilic archaeon DL31]
MPTDLYDVLGAPADASAEELKRAYRGRVREYHPDVNDDPDGDEQFKLIRIANEVLSEPAERKDYDRLGHREYVEKHLDDELPPFAVLPEFEEADDIPTSGSESSTDSSTATPGAETTNSGTASRSSTRTSTSANSSSTSQCSRRNRSSGTSSRTSTSQSGSANASATSKDTDTSRSSRNTAAGADRSESSQWDNVADGRTSRSRSTSSTSVGVRRRRGLRRWYVVVVIALLTYVGGLGGYLLQHRQAAEGVLTDLSTAPVATLLGAFPLVSPTTYVVAAAERVTAGEPGLSLLFLVGVGLLPLVVLTAVAQFGQGSAWAYALVSLGPVATLATYPFVSLPTAAVLVGLVVLPLISGFGFLVDVGRYLLATR